MSVFEFRQWIESMIPWWAPFAAPLLVAAVMWTRWFIMLAIAIHKGMKDHKPSRGSDAKKETK